MGLVLPWVLLLAASLAHATCGDAAPQGRSCPAPPLCSVVGHWASTTGNVQVLAWREGGVLGLRHWSRDLLLEGTAHLAPNTSRPAFASLVVGSSSTPSLCLQLVLACFRNTLWVTELPMVGSIPAVLYGMQRQAAPAQPRSAPACPKQAPASEGTVDIAHNVLVNITLYHNLTTDDVVHDVYRGEAAEDSAARRTRQKKMGAEHFDPPKALEDAAPLGEATGGAAGDPEEEAHEDRRQEAFEEENVDRQTDPPPLIA